MRKCGGMLLAAAMALSVGLSTVPAGAAVAVPACGVLTSKVVKTSTVITVSKCTPAAATGGSGGGTFASSTSSSGTINVTIKWAGTHGTTKGTIKFATAKGLGKCVGATTRFTITGSISGGTGVAFKTIKKGQKVSASVCSAKAGLSLEKGTTLKL